MVELSLHEVQWSAEHGHPVVILRVNGHTTCNLSIVLSTSDAQLLAPKPPSASLERLRLFMLLEAAIGVFDARLEKVRLRLDARMILTGDLHYVAGNRSFDLPASFADALVLAKRAGVPLLIGVHDLGWILAKQPQAGAAAEEPAPALESELGRSITAFIESLQIDDLSGPSRRAG